MFLTGIERVLKRAGVKYTIRPGALTNTAHKGGLREVVAQMFHTTESADSAFRSGRDAPTLAYVERGLGYPLYNILYGRSGHVYVIACGTAAHAGKGSGHGMPKDQANYLSIGHSFDANQYGHPVTAAQLDSAARVAKAFNDDFPTPRRTVMHGEWAPGRRSDPTKVPGGWAALKRAVARASWDGSAPSGGSTSTTKPAAKPKPKPSSGKSSKSISKMASEVIAGHHGTGHANRRRSLGVSQSVYNQVRAEVNRRAGGGSSSGGGKSISQMATEVIQGKHGNGHANRQRSLGVNNTTYAAIRKEVNRRS